MTPIEKKQEELIEILIKFFDFKKEYKDISSIDITMDMIEMLASELSELKEEKPEPVNSVEQFEKAINKWEYILLTDYQDHINNYSRDVLIEMLNDFRPLFSQFTQPEGKDKSKVSDMDIRNAAEEFSQEHLEHTQRDVYTAYKTGAKDMRDGKIYISPTSEDAYKPDEDGAM